MSNLNITGGSEKQNAWATKIANDWMAEYDWDLNNQKLRPESDGMADYIKILEENRIKLLNGFEKITAKVVIDMFVAKRNVAKAMLSQSLKEYQGTK